MTEALQAEALEQEIRTLRSLLDSERDPGGRVFAPLADAYRRAGRISEAVRVLKEGLAKHPDFVTGHVVAAQLYVEQGLGAEGAIAARRALALDGENVNALKALFRVLKEGGESSEVGEIRALLTSLEPGFEKDLTNAPAAPPARARRTREAPPPEAPTVPLRALQTPAPTVDVRPEPGTHAQRGWEIEMGMEVEIAAEIETKPAKEPDKASSSMGALDLSLLAPLPTADLPRSAFSPDPEPARFPELDVLTPVESALEEVLTLDPLAPIAEEPVLDLAALAPEREPVVDLPLLAPEEEPIVDLPLLAPEEEVASLAPTPRMGTRPAPDEEVISLDALAPDEEVVSLDALAPDEEVVSLDALAPDEEVISLDALAPDEEVVSLDALAPDEEVASLAPTLRVGTRLAPDEEVVSLDALAPDEDVVSLAALAPDEDVISLETLAPDEAILDLPLLAPAAADEDVMDVAALAPAAGDDDTILDLDALAPDEEPIVDLPLLAPAPPPRAGTRLGEEPVVDLVDLAPEPAADEPVLDLAALAPDEEIVALAPTPRVGTRLAPDDGDPIVALPLLAPDPPPPAVPVTLSMGFDEPVFDLDALAPPRSAGDATDLAGLAHDEAVDIAFLSPGKPDDIVIDLDAIRPDGAWTSPSAAHPTDEPPEEKAERPVGSKADPSEEVRGVDTAPLHDDHGEPVYTRTLAELYAAQGAVREALGVLGRLQSENPGDAEIAKRIADLEAGVGVGEEEVETLARDLAESGAGGPEVDSPFSWADKDLDAPAHTPGPTIREYFDGLLGWEPREEP